MDITTKTLSLANARECVQASADAYDVNPTVRDLVTDTNIVIEDKGNCILISCRGTKSMKNFLTDFQFLRESMTFDGTLVKVHRGFLAAAQSVIGQVSARVMQLQKTGAAPKPIVLCGHSLGGALAMLLAIYLRRAGWLVHSIYTFGQPRVGDRAFANYCEAQFGDRHFRFEDELDLVPRIPLPGRYWHSGEDIFMMDGGYVENPVFLWKLVKDAWRFYRLKSSGPLAMGWALLDDHHESKYIARVNALKEPQVLTL